MKCYNIWLVTETSLSGDQSPPLNRLNLLLKARSWSAAANMQKPQPKCSSCIRRLSPSLLIYRAIRGVVRSLFFGVGAERNLETFPQSWSRYQDPSLVKRQTLSMDDMTVTSYVDVMYLWSNRFRRGRCRTEKKKPSFKNIAALVIHNSVTCQRLKVTEYTQRWITFKYQPRTKCMNLILIMTQYRVDSQFYGSGPRETDCRTLFFSLQSIEGESLTI